MRRALLLLWLITLLLLGCGINRAGLTHDIRHLLDRCGVQPETFQVTMGERTRTGIAEFSSNAADIEAIVAELALEETNPTDLERELATWLEDGRSQFDHPLLRPQAGVTVYRSSRGSSTLRLPRGSSFEYLILYYDDANGVALIQVSYAYG